MTLPCNNLQNSFPSNGPISYRAKTRFTKSSMPKPYSKWPKEPSNGKTEMPQVTIPKTRKNRPNGKEAARGFIR